MVVLLSLLIVANCAPQETLPRATRQTDQVSQDWLRFRGPDGCGVANPQHPLPNRLDLQSELRWKAEVPTGHSSPIIVGDAVFITSYEPGKLSTHCLDRATGKARWRRDVSVDAFEKVHPQHGPASATPASDGQRLFVVFGSYGMIAYDLQGEELWKRTSPSRRNLFGSATSPVVVDDKLVVFSGSEEESLLQVFEPNSGKLLWERRRAGPASSWSTPVPWQSGNQRALLIYEPFHLRACSLQDGSDLWSVPGLADEPITTPQIHGDLIFTSSYNLRTNREAIGLPLFEALLKECDTNGDGAIDSEEAKTNKSILSRPDADGQGDHPLRMFFRMLDDDRDGRIRAAEWPRIRTWMDPWNHANGIIALRPSKDGSAPSLVWQHEVGVPECPTPIIYNERLYAIRNGGVVTCLQADTGKLLFQDRFVAGGPYYASPVAGDGKIFLASARGTVTVLAAEVEPRILATVDLNESISATPALAGSQIVVRTDKHVWLFASPDESK